MRPSSFKKGGGRLNGVDVTIVGYEFTDDQITFGEGGALQREPFKAGKYKAKDGKMKERFHALTCLLSLLVDGAESPVTEPMFAGGADDWAVSEDGQEIWDAQYEDADTAEAAATDDPKSEKQLGQGTAFFVFLESLCKSGFPDSSFPEHRANFTAMIGSRVRVVQVEDPRKKGETRKGKDGKDYKYNLTAVDDVLALPDGGGSAAPAPAAKTASKTAKPAAGKATAKPAAGKTATKAAPKVDIDTLATETLFAIVREQGDVDEETASVTLAASKLSMAVLKKLQGNAAREDVRKRIYTILPDLTEQGVQYDKTAGTVTVPAE
jgi:hypothetical protein